MNTRKILCYIYVRASFWRTDDSCHNDVGVTAIDIQGTDLNFNAGISPLPI